VSADDDAVNDRLGVELETFRYAVSHDLRFPLRVIDGFSRALEEDYGDKLDGDGAQYLAAIRKGVARMETMVARLDELLRLASAPLTSCRLDVTALATAIVDKVRGAYAHGVTVEIAPALIATGDRRLVETALAALIDNAFKFTAKAQAATVSIGRDGDALVVRDNGTGFDSSAERLFSPFRRLHTGDEYPGDGIGLAIVQRVAARHGGRVWAVATPGGGGAALYLTLSR
jgi:signal transduction histidine kinase